MASCAEGVGLDSHPTSGDELQAEPDAGEPRGAVVDAVPLKLRFVAGTLELRGADTADARLGAVAKAADGLRWDPRTASWRAPAKDYAPLVLALRALGLPFDDEARRYEILGTGATGERTPRPYQQQALEAWLRAKGRGVVVLPTGAGKTQVAMMAIDKQRRSTLVVAPTLDLVRQWYDGLRETFRTEVGVIGGGEHDLRPLTVTTYDSAYLHMENIGARFGLVVFDECHHLPSGAYSLAALGCLAPFRLGLTATPERADGRDADLVGLIGPIVHRCEIGELSGEYLAAYETQRIPVALSESERAEYDAARALYLGFIRAHGIRMSVPSGFGEFIMRAARSSEGREALRAYRRQRELAFAAPAKLDHVALLLHRHRSDRTLVFTQDNATAYLVSRRFLVPVITHQTRVKERSEILARFTSGEYRALATSKVLNEGVDVPEANVAIVLSGSGSVRESVQRLGRILRPRDGKFAQHYELVSADTAETNTSDRRREHEAYR